MIKIDCYMSARCGSEEALRKNIKEALSLEGVVAEVSLRRIEDDEAEKLGLRGSPSVFIDGAELQPMGAGIAGFA